LSWTAELNYVIYIAISDTTSVGTWLYIRDRTLDYGNNSVAKLCFLLILSNYIKYNLYTMRVVKQLISASRGVY